MKGAKVVDMMKVFYENKKTAPMLAEHQGHDVQLMTSTDGVGMFCETCEVDICEADDLK